MCVFGPILEFAARRRKRMKAVLASMKNRIVRDTRGASMVEYMVLVGVIGIVALGAFKLMGSTIVSKVSSQTSQLGTIGAPDATNRSLGGFVGAPTNTAPNLSPIRPGMSGLAVRERLGSGGI
jgi:pilus assembly protein Flp/PilA